MKVILIPSAGFCLGVRRAVDTALAAARNTAATVYTDGPLVHNDGILAALAQQGVCVAEDPLKGLPEGATLVIRAHGIAPERRHALAIIAGRLIDATCPDVARIQGLVRARAMRGGYVIILGDPGHAEVIGLLGHAAGRGRVVSGPDEIASLSTPNGPVTLVAQSTQDTELFAAVADAVRNRFPDVEILDTICEATRRRQTDVRTLAPTVDAFVVVGSSTSANTRRLAAIAARLRPTLLVADAADPRLADLADLAAVGLTAGASTPDDAIRAVYERLQNLPTGENP